MISVVNFLHFTSGAPVALCFSLVLKLQPDLAWEGVSSVQKLFLVHNSLPGAQVPIPNYFVSLLSLFLPYLILRSLSLGPSASNQDVLSLKGPFTS